MDKAIVWLRAHPWESATAALAAALVAAVVTLVVVSTGGGDPVAEPPTTTTSTSLVDEPVTGSTSPTTTLGEEAPPLAEGPGPFGTESPEAVTAVIVDNVPDVGLQIGIDQAPLIIEAPVEGGLTRYTALFGETIPELVGPVRSLRPVSADLLALFRPRVFTTGGQPFVLGMTAGAGAVLVTPEDSVSFQTLERPRPYHLFVTPTAESAGSAPVGAPWEYGDWAGGEPALEVTIPYANPVTWRFEDGMYVRYQNDSVVEVQPTFDADPVPMTRDTIIVMSVNQKSAGYTDSAGADVPTFDVIGSGEVLVHHDGGVVEGTWTRASQASPYVFTSQDGSLLPIPDGSIYLGLTAPRAES